MKFKIFNWIWIGTIIGSVVVYEYPLWENHKNKYHIDVSAYSQPYTYTAIANITSSNPTNYSGNIYSLKN
ncbi:hypothetical protein KKB18_04880 [bacterium]|nr:hypothetical protein [bacterium]